MRLWTAAIRSAGKADHKISRAGFCSSVRRSRSTFTAAEAAADQDCQISKLVEPSIYLCFRETIRSTNYVVRRLGLNDVAARTAELTVEAYKKFGHANGCSPKPNCITLGSKIIIPVHSNEGFREICWTDISKRPMKLEVCSDECFSVESLKNEIKTGEAVKYVRLPGPRVQHIKIGVISGELYLLDFDNKQTIKMYPSMNKVLHPYFRSRFDGSLDYDLYVRDLRRFSESTWLDAIIFSESKKILAKSEYGLYCFDAINPEIGWTAAYHPCLEEFRLEKALVIHNHHPDIGYFNLVFNVDEPGVKAPRVEALFVSDRCDFAQPIDHFIEIPEKYSLYVSRDSYHFVYLGAHKFGIVLNNTNWIYGNPDGKGLVFLLTYEYDTIVDPTSAEDKSRPNIDIKSRLLKTRVFTYDTVEKPYRTYRGAEVDLIGASFIQQLV